MRQKLLCLLAALAFLLPARISAFNYKYEGVTLRYEVIDEEAKTCKISGYKDFSGAVVIPDVANDGTTDYSVTEIGESAFKQFLGLTSVVIPNSVTEIGASAFSGCRGLTSVEIPNSVTEIGRGAFWGCDGLTSVVIGNSVTSIGDEAFCFCDGLTSVVIGNSVTSIGFSAFYGCSGLIKFAYPDTLKKPFSNGTAIAYNPEVAIIENGWIWGPDKSAIYFAPLNLEGEYSIPESVTSIGGSAFYGCSGLTTVVIPNLVTSIGDDAFKNCSRLKKSAYPDTLEKPFSNGTAVAYNPEGAIIENGWIWGPDKSAIYFAPLNLEGEYSIPESVESIGASAFEGCSGLTSVEIPNSVTSIGGSAFSLCSGLTSVVIPNSVTSIGDHAFYYCYGLTSVEIPNSVTSIGDYAFYGCRGLTSVEIPNSVTSIGGSAFEGCYSLTSVEIPNSVTEIGGYAFSYCDLTSVEIPNSVTSIGDYAFYECRGLNSVEIPNSVTEFGMSVFKDCTSLTSLTFNAVNCKTYGDKERSVFPISLETLVFGNSVKRIPDYACYGGEKLTSVIIGTSVESIGSGAFWGCRRLTSVVIPNSVTEIGQDAFSCYRLETIIIGCGVKTIGREAFRNGPESRIYITAQTPPEIQSNTFDNYKGILYLQGQAAVNAYDDDKYWGNFNNELMTVPTALEIEGITSISGNAGDTFQLNATMTPADVTLPYIFWRSTNPKIATVDHNGLVTLQEFNAEDLTRAEGDEDNDGTCRIIAESLYFDGPIAEITVSNTGINGVQTVIDRNDNSIDYSRPYDVYNMNGLKVGESTDGLSQGIYIIRQGKAAVKTVVR